MSGMTTPFCHPRKLSAGIHPKKATRDARYTLSGMMKVTDPVCTEKAEGSLPVSTCNMFVNHSTLPEKKMAPLLKLVLPGLPWVHASLLVEMYPL